MAARSRCCRGWGRGAAPSSCLAKPLNPPNPPHPTLVYHTPHPTPSSPPPPPPFPPSFPSPGPFNVGNPGEFTMLELAQMVKEVVAPDAEIVFRENTADDPGKRRPDITKIKNALGWVGRGRPHGGREAGKGEARVRGKPGEG